MKEHNVEQNYIFMWFFVNPDPIKNKLLLYKNIQRLVGKSINKTRFYKQVDSYIQSNVLIQDKQGLFPMGIEFKTYSMLAKDQKIRNIVLKACKKYFVKSKTGNEFVVNVANEMQREMFKLKQDDLKQILNGFPDDIVKIMKDNKKELKKARSAADAIDSHKKHRQKY